MKTCTHYAILLSLVPLAAGYVPLQMERTQYSSITNQAEHRGTSRATGMKDTYSDSIFNIHEQYEIENLSFTEKIKEKEKQGKLTEEAEHQKQNVQFALIAIGILSFIVLFLLLSHSIIVTEKWISFFGILGLLIIFEFINLFIHPFLERVTHHSPVLMLLSLVFLASLLIPLHHIMEKWIKEKMTVKNKKIRLKNAKKTIEELEEETNNS